MKRNTIRLLTAIALISGFTAAHADVISLSSTDLPYDMGAHPADQTVYSVFHDNGSFDDVFRFTLSGVGDVAASSVSLNLPGLNGGPSSLLNSGQQIALFSDPDGDGASGDNTALLSVAYDSANGTILAKNLAGGSYYFLLSGTAEGTLGGQYLFTANTTAPVPEPESYALMLAGLGLIGFVGKRRLQRSATAFA